MFTDEYREPIDIDDWYCSWSGSCSDCPYFCKYNPEENYEYPPDDEENT